VCSLALGISLDWDNPAWYGLRSYLTDPNTASIVIGLVGLGSVILVLGYLIGTLTLLSLRPLFFRNRWNYEFKLSSATYSRIEKKILRSKDDSIKENEKNYAAIVFDHAYIDDRIHNWIVRRWNGFMIASFSAVGLVLSLVLGAILGVSFTIGWIGTVTLFIVLFVLQSRISWRETMEMITFLTRVKRFDRKV